MSNSISSTEGLVSDLAATTVKPAQTQVASGSGPKGSANEGLKAADIDVSVQTKLREPITSVANQAQSGKENTLESLEGVAEDIKDAIETLNTALEKSPTKAMISKDEQLNRFIVKIADEKSGEIVREIPSEAVLKFARNLQEIKGLLFDKAL